MSSLEREEGGIERDNFRVSQESDSRMALQASRIVNHQIQVAIFDREARGFTVWKVTFFSDEATTFEQTVACSGSPTSVKCQLRRHPWPRETHRHWQLAQQWLVEQAVLDRREDGSLVIPSSLETRRQAILVPSVFYLQSDDRFEGLLDRFHLPIVGLLHGRNCPSAWATLELPSSRIYNTIPMRQVESLQRNGCGRRWRVWCGLGALVPLRRLLPPERRRGSPARPPPITTTCSLSPFLLQLILKGHLFDDNACPISLVALRRRRRFLIGNCGHALVRTSAVKNGPPGGRCPSCRLVVPWNEVTLSPTRDRFP